ncbi:hypothetical protein [Saccharothrix sp.]|uniref:hypothetical protein n=1 Tax=Saccharothrix sp. TaxID=1873460 RepID=UPI0028115157|nr:hypothetical protein [Saccharothrix sp.]
MSGHLHPPVRRGSAHDVPAVLRAAVMILMLGVLSLVTGFGTGSTASAVPAAETAAPDLADLPAELKKYDPHSAAWKTAPWNAIPACTDRGGDFSLWVISVIKDAPALLEFFQPSAFGPDVADGDRRDAILAGYRKLGESAFDIVPAGLCVDDVKRWAKADPDMKPFGFVWGVGGQQTSFYCTDRDPSAPRAGEINRYLGAERAACDGFTIPCDNARGGDQARCAAWNAFAENHARQVEELRREAVAQHPANTRAQVRSRVGSGPIAGAIGVGVTAVAVLVVMLLVSRRGRRPASGRR